MIVMKRLRTLHKVTFLFAESSDRLGLPDVFLRFHEVPYVIMLQLNAKSARVSRPK